jgi:uroporphyrin-III C-methyltransferase
MPSTSFAPPLDVAGHRVLVCGGGTAALAPIRVLLAAGAEVTVVGPEISPTVADLAARNRVRVHARSLLPGDLDGVALVVPAAGEAVPDEQALQLARARGVLATLPRRAAYPAAGPEARSGTGEVILVGGGPGDLSLLTLGGLDAVRRADVIVTDRLAPLAALEQARPDAVIVDVAKIPRGAYTSQQRINAILVEHAQSGRTVVRLKGGDSFVFGRGGEEWQACAAAGIPVTVLPGVSSATAAPALAGIPLTHRNHTQGFTVVSGHAPPGDAGGTVDWAALARANTTLVILMGVATLPAITAELLRHGMPADTPALTVADAGLPGQFTVRATLGDIAVRSHAEGIKPPAVTVIGAVAGFRPG